MEPRHACLVCIHSHFFRPLFSLPGYPSGPPKNRCFPGNVPGASVGQKGVKNDPCKGWGYPPIFDIFIFFRSFSDHIFFVDVKFLETRFSIFENRFSKFHFFTFFEDHTFWGFDLARARRNGRARVPSPPRSYRPRSRASPRTRFRCACRFAHLASSPGTFFHD